MIPINKQKLLDAVREVESGNGKFLTSPAGAKGAYQFMPATAKAYGVNPNDADESDDREGAWKLLCDEYRALGSVELALAAYNAGRPRVMEAIQKAGSKDWDKVKAAFLEMGLAETAHYVGKYQKIWLRDLFKA